MFNHLKLCIATAIHNFKWLKIYSYLFNLNTNIDKSWCLDTHFIPNNGDLVDRKKQIKNDTSHDQQDKGRYGRAYKVNQSGYITRMIGGDLWRAYYCLRPGVILSGYVGQRQMLTGSITAGCNSSVPLSRYVSPRSVSVANKRRRPNAGSMLG